MARDLVAQWWRDRAVVRNASAHLPAARVVVSDRPVHVAGYDGVAAAVGALEHVVGPWVEGLEAALRYNLCGHGEDEARHGEAKGDGCEDGWSLHFGCGGLELV